MIRIVYVMLIVAIKDLKIYLRNLNLPREKSTICFELLAQKKKTGKQTISVLNYKY